MPLHRFTQRLCVAAGTLAYAGVFAWTLATIIVPNYQYMGYLQAPRSLGAGVALFLVAWLPGLWLPSRVTKPSQVSCWLLYLLLYVPAMLVPYFAVPIRQDRILPLALCLLICYVLLSLVPILPRMSIVRLNLGPRTYWLLIAGMSAVFLGVVIVEFGIQLEGLSLENVYALRGEFRQARESSGALAPYFLSWQSKVLNPLLIAYGLTRRNAFALAVGVLLQVYVFSITGQKSVFLSPLLVGGAWIALLRGGRLFGSLAAWGAAGLLTVCSFIAVVGEPIFGLADPMRPVSLLVRRLLATPGLLTGYYYDFFSVNPKAHLGHSILKGAVEYPYALPPPQLIGSTYFEHIGTVPIAANANFWADGYANFGFPGVIGATVLLAAVLWLLDRLSDGPRGLIACLLVAFPTYSLANTAVLTALLTHGIGLLVVVLYFIPWTLNEASPQQASNN